jgi:hypothetical protein
MTRRHGSRRISASCRHVGLASSLRIAGGLESDPREASMTAATRRVFRAMSLIGIIPTLVGLFLLTRYLMTRIPPSSLPEHTLFAFTFMAVAAGGWLLRSAAAEEDAARG